MSTVIVSEIIVRFGKHKGLPLREIPQAYLRWCFENSVGGPELIDAIGSLLGEYSAKAASKRKPAKTKELWMGETDCSALFDQQADWPERQDWDGVTAPWLEQLSEADEEFREMFRS